MIHFDITNLELELQELENQTLEEDNIQIKQKGKKEEGSEG